MDLCEIIDFRSSKHFGLTNKLSASKKNWEHTSGIYGNEEKHAHSLIMFCIYVTYIAGVLKTRSNFAAKSKVRARPNFLGEMSTRMQV